jgi:hypothetical protein
MGADIHFRVEYYGPIETVVQNDTGDIVVVPNGDFGWQAAEEYKENEHTIRFKQMHAEGRVTDADLKAWIEEEPAITLNYGDRFYTGGRNYALFGKLSGVRRDEYDAIIGDDHPRFGTIPEDCCKEIEEELGPDDLGLHSHGWATLTELLEADWSDLHEDGGENYGYSGFGETLLQMQAVAIEKCGGNTDYVRAVWAYDDN